LNTGNEQDSLLDDLARSRHTRESGYPVCFNSSEFLDSRFRGNDEGHLCLGDSSENDCIRNPLTNRNLPVNMASEECRYGE